MSEKCLCAVIGIGNTLLCTLEGADWHFYLRPLDQQVYVPFSIFHKKEIKPSDVTKFLPNWQHLRWKKIKDSIMGKSESFAKDSQFEVNVYSSAHGKKNHQEVVDAFLTFMQSH